MADLQYGLEPKAERQKKDEIINNFIGQKCKNYDPGQMLDVGELDQKSLLIF